MLPSSCAVRCFTRYSNLDLQGASSTIHVLYRDAAATIAVVVVVVGVCFMTKCPPHPRGGCQLHFAQDPGIATNLWPDQSHIVPQCHFANHRQTAAGARVLGRKSPFRGLMLSGPRGRCSRPNFGCTPGVTTCHRGERPNRHQQQNMVFLLWSTAVGIFLQR